MIHIQPKRIHYGLKVPCILFFFLSLISFGQVGIGTTNPQASLEISSSTNGGVLITKYALTGNNDNATVINPTGGVLQVGTLVFNTTAVSGFNALPSGFVYWNGSIWVPVAPEPAWSLDGNSITASKFIGTLNNFPFNIHVNNNKRFGLTASGQIVPFNSNSSVLIGAASTSTNTFGVAIGDASNVNGFAGVSLGKDTVSNERAIAIGELSNAGGANSIAIGRSSTSPQTFGTAIGNSASANSSSSTAIGNLSSATGINTIAIGNQASTTMTSAVAIGDNSSATSLNATAVGDISRASGSSSSAFGSNSNASGPSATAIGNSVTASGQSSTAIGDRSIASGISSSTLGDNSSASATNSTAIGSLSVANTPNTIQLGSAAITSLNCVVPLTVTSDKRFKDNVKENVPGLDFITKLKPVTYIFNNKKLSNFKNESDYRSSNIHTSRIETGFLAQDVATTAKKLGYDFNGVQIPEDETKNSYGISYSLFVVPLVKAVQEQQNEISDLKKKIARLEQLIEKR